MKKSKSTDKILSNPFSTGGGGYRFESNVQASFLAIMLTNGFVPCLAFGQIYKIEFQTKNRVDDIVVHVKNESTQSEHRLFSQIKHKIQFTKSDKKFLEVIQAAWRDFNTVDFRRNIDTIALITGPITQTDSHVRELLEWARHRSLASDFYNDVKLANYSSDTKRAKLKVFQDALTSANGGTALTDEDVFIFLKHFYLLGYDLDVKQGINLSLLHSLLHQNTSGDAHGIWGQIIIEVQSFNQNGGSITRDNISQELINYFNKKVPRQIPEKYLSQINPNISDSVHPIIPDELSVTALLGQWDNNNQHDQSIIASMIRIEPHVWEANLRSTIDDLEENNLTVKNGLIIFTNRRSLWMQMGSKLLDVDLTRFKSLALNVLGELDPQFELSTEKRFFASIYNKTRKFSPQLREGVAETLALLGNHSDSLNHCTTGKSHQIAFEVIYALLNTADWQQWAGLTDVLPTLAEASPEAFLRAIEGNLASKSDLFDLLFVQESDGFTTKNYMVGLLWGLESLAWDDIYFGRVMLILAALAHRDNNNSKGNSAIKSLTTILLPWFPETLATFDQQIITLKAIKNDFPDVAWSITLSLLPSNHQISMGTYKSKWRNVLPDDWKPEISDADYRNQITLYSELVLEMAQDSMDKTIALLSHIHRLYSPVLDKFLENLPRCLSLSTEDQKLTIWRKLTDLVRNHRRYKDANWTLPENVLSKIDGLAGLFIPTDRKITDSILFNLREHDLYEGNDWNEQRKILEQKRQDVISNILSSEGIQGVIGFINLVEAPAMVGWNLGCVEGAVADSNLLPNFLEKNNKKYFEFVSGYVRSRFHSSQVAWLDSIDRSNWSISQSCQLLVLLPFELEIWKRATVWLGTSENDYWHQVPVNPFGLDGDIANAVAKLLEVKRPDKAIDCLYAQQHFNKLPIDNNQVIQALLDAVSEQIEHIDSYHVIELIQKLQNDPSVVENDLFSVEWAYLPILRNYGEAPTPKTLSKALSSNPEFFCKIIRLLYRSKIETNNQKKEDEANSNIVENANRLLDGWQRPPGLLESGEFFIEEFNKWFEFVTESCTESGHFEVAMLKVGEVLFYTPQDPNGFWINEQIARVLNEQNANNMRDGFCTEVYNSRGVHMVNPTGQDERDLAQTWLSKANDLDNKGYIRFASRLRELAQSYERDAVRVSEWHRTC